MIIKKPGSKINKLIIKKDNYPLAFFLLWAYSEDKQSLIVTLQRLFIELFLLNKEIRNA